MEDLQLYLELLSLLSPDQVVSVSTGVLQNGDEASPGRVHSALTEEELISDLHSSCFMVDQGSWTNSHTLPLVPGQRPSQGG